eukprot:703308-Pleurochrysis_carterae.AAC.2
MASPERRRLGEWLTRGRRSPSGGERAGAGAEESSGWGGAVGAEGARRSIARRGLWRQRSSLRPRQPSEQHDRGQRVRQRLRARAIDGGDGGVEDAACAYVCRYAGRKAGRLMARHEGMQIFRKARQRTRMMTRMRTRTASFSPCT